MADELPPECLCRIPVGAEADPRLRRGCLWPVLVVVGRHTDREGLAWPGVDRIAEEARVSPRSVQRALQRLVELGWLSVAGASVGGRKRPTRYQIIPGAGAPKPRRGSVTLSEPETVTDSRRGFERERVTDSHPERVTDRSERVTDSRGNPGVKVSPEPVNPPLRTPQEENPSAADAAQALLEERWKQLYRAGWCQHPGGPPPVPRGETASPEAWFRRQVAPQLEHPDHPGLWLHPLSHAIAGLRHYWAFSEDGPSFKPKVEVCAPQLGLWIRRALGREDRIDYGLEDRIHSAWQAMSREPARYLELLEARAAGLDVTLCSDWQDWAAAAEAGLTPGMDPEAARRRTAEYCEAVDRRPGARRNGAAPRGPLQALREKSARADREMELDPDLKAKLAEGRP